MPEKKYATMDDIAALVESINGLKDIVVEMKGVTPKAAETPEEKEIKKAGPVDYRPNEVWDEIAKEIIGAEKIAWTGTKYLAGGGQYFCVCIKDGFSNAGKDYLERYKADLRGKEVGSTGDAGVRQFCNLIMQNLKRGKPVNQK